MSSIVLFTLIALALAAAALAFLLPTLLRGRNPRTDVSRASINSEIYRQEVEELEGEAARGDLPAAAVQSERDEMHRRLVDQTHGPAMAEPNRRRTRRVAVAVAIALPIAAGALYLAVGRPGSLTDDTTPTAAGEGDYVAQLQTHLARQPRDARGWVLLARAEAERNEFKAAADAYQKALTVSEKVARDPGVLCEYADALGMAQGHLAGKPAELVAQALSINPKHPTALEMAGSAAYEEGRFGDAVRYWKELLSDLTPGSERHAELSAAVARAERKASVSLPR